MKKFFGKLISTLIILWLGLLFAGVFYWSKLSPEERGELLQKVKLLEERDPIVKQLLEAVKGEQGKFADESVLGRVEEIFIPVLCPKIETGEIVQAEKHKVYQWRDEQGRLHFSDAPPEEVTTDLRDLTDNFESLNQNFEINFLSNRSGFTSTNRDQITAELNQIYYILSRDFKLEELRKVFVNLRFFSIQEDFAAYRDQIAPGMPTTTGFYNPRENEAVIFEQLDKANTLSVIRHESTHIILASLFGPVTVWFNEGLSEYFERLNVFGQAKKVDFDQVYRKELITALSLGELPALRDFFAEDHSTFYADDAAINYAMAWSLIFYMLDSAEEKQVFHNLIRYIIENPCTHLDAVGIIESRYAGGLKRFENNWMDWLERQGHTAHYY